MNNDENAIQYSISENVGVIFSILSNVRDVSLKLQKGAADICIQTRKIPLPLGQEFQLPVWESLWPCLASITACDFLVRGNHYVYYSGQMDNAQDYSVCKSLFRVSPSGESYSFILENNIQLHIFASKLDSDIVVKSTRGIPEINGQKLLLNTQYLLTPFMSFLIKSSNNEPYSVYVRGLRRKIKLSIMPEITRDCMEVVVNRIFAACLVAKESNHTRNNILVLGSKNVGKSYFCRSLLNKAFDDKLKSVYIDLDIRRNSTTAGAICFTEVEDRLNDDLFFTSGMQKILHFGDVNFDANTIRLYYLLIRQMGSILSCYQSDSERGYTLSVIDACGTLGEDIQTIECLLQSFPLDMVVVIGDQLYYDYLKYSILTEVASEFICKPNDIEPWNIQYETNYIDYSIQRYFYDRTAEPCVQNLCIVKFENISIYRVLTRRANRSAIDSTITDLRIVAIPCNPSLENCILAVSMASITNERLPITEIKYYVCFKKVDMFTKTVTVLTPKNETFTNGILLMGCLKLPGN